MGDMVRRVQQYPLVFLGYAILAVALTYPLVLHLGDRVPVENFGESDAAEYLWVLWLAEKKPLSVLFSSHTDYVFYPTGVSLGFSATSPLNALIFLPLRHFFGLITAYNLLVLMSFVLSGFGVFLLTQFILSGDSDNKGVDWRPCFLAGFVYAFSPYHFHEVFVGHLSLLAIEWIPFAVLFFLRLFHEQYQRLRDVFLAAFFLFLVGFSEMQYLGFVLLFFLFYLSYMAWFDFPTLKRFYRSVVLALLLFLLLSVPFVLPSLKAFSSEGYLSTRLTYSIGAASAYSMDVLGFVLPSVYHLLLGGFSRNVRDSILKLPSGFGVVAPFGYVVMLLVLYFFVKDELAFKWISGLATKTGNKLKDERVMASLTFVIPVCVFAIFLAAYPVLGLDFVGYLTFILCSIFLILLYYVVRERRISFWFLSAIVFFILSFGPILHFFNREYYPMPYIILSMFPGFSLFRCPYRFGAMLMLSLSVISVFSLNGILKPQRRRNLKFIVILFLISFEFLAVPVPLQELKTPEIYKKISQDKGDYALLEVPVSPWRIKLPNMVGERNVPAYLYYQTIHGKKIVGGWASREPESVLNFLDNTPLIVDLCYPSAGNALSYNLSEIGLSVLSHYNIKYVILHRSVAREFFGASGSSRVEFMLDSVFNHGEKVFDDGEVVVYAVPKIPASSLNVFPRLGGGWYGPDVVESGRVPVRWMKNNSSMILVNPSVSAKIVNVSFSVRSFQRPVVLESTYDGVLLDSRTVYPESWSRIALSEINLPPKSESTISFNVLQGCLAEGCVQPTGSQRCVSAAFTNITVQSSKT